MRAHRSLPPPSAIVAVLFCAALAAGEGARPHSQTPAASILAEGERILGALKHTLYAHKTRVDEAAGRYELDCSGLVGYVLKRTAPEALSAIPYDKQHARPRAFEFYEAFKAAPEGEGCTWRRVAKLAEAQPGDIIAWRKKKIVEGETTGHVVIVAAAPVREDDGLLRVVVIDSTTQAHSTDSRAEGESGVGKGTVWFRVDGKGRATAFRSSSGARMVEFPIAVGRAQKPKPQD